MMIPATASFCVGGIAFVHSGGVAAVSDWTAPGGWRFSAPDAYDDGRCRRDCRLGRDCHAARLCAGGNTSAWLDSPSPRHRRLPRASVARRHDPAADRYRSAAVAMVSRIAIPLGTSLEPRSGFWCSTRFESCIGMRERKRGWVWATRNSRLRQEHGSAGRLYRRFCSLLAQSDCCGSRLPLQ